MNFLAYILKEIFSQKIRALLTIFAIAWGVAAITSMLAVGEGLRLMFNHAMNSAGKSILYVAGGQTSLPYKGQAINQRILLTLQDLQTIKNAIPHIQITPEYSATATLSYKGHDNSLLISAVEPIYGKLRNINVAAGGRFIQPQDNYSHAQVIVLGSERAKLLFRGVNKISPVGLWITVNNKSFQVIGVMEKKLQFWGYTMPDGFLAWIPANTYVGLARPQNISNFIVVPDDPGQLNIIKQQIIKIIALNHHVNPNDKNMLEFRDSHESQKKTAQFFGGMEIFLGVVGALTLVVAGVGVANVMFVSVRRNTREIGIRMAVGARSYQILNHYIIEALITTALGGLIGLLAAKAIVYAITLIPIKQQHLVFVGAMQPQLSLLVIIVALVTLGITGLLAGLFPALHAANINPAEALRHE